MIISQETRDRIVSAANQLFEQAGRADFPTVDAVRRISKTNMNDASTVMKEWRRMQTTTAAPVAVAVPERVQQASHAALAAMWAEAQGIATEALQSAQADWEKERAEAETLRGELSNAFETQAAELDAAQARIAELTGDATAAAHQVNELRGELAAAIERANTAAARAVEIERRADDLKTAYADQQKRADERLAKLETDRDDARREAGTAREEAAKLRGQVEAMQSQTADLVRAIGHRQADGGSAQPVAKSSRAKKAE